MFQTIKRTQLRVFTRKPGATRLRSFKVTMWWSAAAESPAYQAYTVMMVDLRSQVFLPSTSMIHHTYVYSRLDII